MYFLRYSMGKNCLCSLKFLNHLTIKSSWREESNLNFSPLIWWGKGVVWGVWGVGFYFKITLSASNQVMVILSSITTGDWGVLSGLRLDAVLPLPPPAHSGSRLLCQYWMWSRCPSFTSLLVYFEGYIIHIELHSQFDAACTYSGGE